MPTTDLHLWDNGQLRTLAYPIEVANPHNLAVVLHYVSYEGRTYYPLSCIFVGSAHVYLNPVTEDAVIEAALAQWRPRSQNEAESGTKGLTRYDDGYRSRLAGLSDRLAAAASLDAWLRQEIFEGFIALRDGVIGYFPGYSPHQHFMARVIADIAALPEHPKSLIAVGSGFGRILLPLKQALPDIHCCGIEPSAAGIEITRRAAAHFGLEVELHQCTLAEAATALAKRFELALTHSVVVQIPEAPLTILRQLSALTTRWMHLYEHFTEMLGTTRRDIMSLYYLTNIARYETGMLMPIAQASGQGFHLRQAARLGSALNPFEEPSFVQIEVE